MKINTLNSIHPKVDVMPSLSFSFQGLHHFVSPERLDIYFFDTIICKRLMKIIKNRCAIKSLVKRQMSKNTFSIILNDPWNLNAKSLNNKIKKRKGIKLNEKKTTVFYLHAFSVSKRKMTEWIIFLRKDR